LLKYKEIYGAKYENVNVIRNFISVVQESNVARIYFQNGKIEVSYFDEDIIKIFILAKQDAHAGGTAENLQ
jgi:hypothetical protein